MLVSRRAFFIEEAEFRSATCFQDANQPYHSGVIGSRGERDSIRATPCGDLAVRAGYHHIRPVIRIAINQAAFDAIAATMPIGSVGYEAQTNEKGERLIWLDPNAVAKLRYLRGPGESYSDVIVRLAAQTTAR
jgi:hypothetical protein